jgi:hypothetical protein
MRALRVVLTAPALDEGLGFVQRIEDFPVQQLIPQLPLKDSTYPFSHGLLGSMKKSGT